MGQIREDQTMAALWGKMRFHLMNMKLHTELDISATYLSYMEKQSRAATWRSPRWLPSPCTNLSRNLRQSQLPRAMRWRSPLARQWRRLTLKSEPVQRHLSLLKTVFDCWHCLRSDMSMWIEAMPTQCRNLNDRHVAQDPKCACGKKTKFFWGCHASPVSLWKWHAIGGINFVSEVQFWSVHSWHLCVFFFAFCGSQFCISRHETPPLALEQWMYRQWVSQILTAHGHIAVILLSWYRCACI